MSNNSDFSDLGRDVGRAVRDAVEDFTHSRTFDEIKRSVDDIRRGVDDAIDKMNSPKPGSGPIPGPTPGPVEPPFQAAPIRQERAAPQKREFNPNRKKEKPRFPAPSRAKSITFLVLGIVFGSIFSLLSVAFLLATMLGASPMAFPAAFFGMLAVVSAVGIISGGVGCSFHKRFRAYCECLGRADFCTVEQLAAQVGRSKKKTLRDLNKMIVRGWFPHCHIDRAGTTFMANEETYRQYLRAEQSRMERENREAARSAPVDTGNKDLDEAIEEGRSYIRRIHEANDAIPGEAVSRRLDEMEDIGIHIFAVVEHNPEKLPEIRRFMNYYLPTTLKLLDAYREFDRQPVQGETLASAKREIEETLDTIVLAFRNLLDSLYEKDAMDVSADISVLRAMFAREGLTGKDFKKKDTSAAQEQDDPQIELKL